MSAWMSGMLKIALSAVLGLSTLLAAAVLYTLGHRVMATLADRRRMRRRSLYAEQVDLLAAGELTPEQFVRGVRPRDTRHVENLLLAVAAKFTGEVRTLLSEAFVRLGAVERNRRRTGAWVWWDRADAARRLGLMGDPSVRSTLHGLLKDANVEVRIAAARALIEMGNLQWLTDLIGTFDEENPFSTLRLADVVLEAGQQAIPALIDYLGKARQPRGAAVAIDILGDMRALEAEPTIRHTLLVAQSIEVRAACCRALGRIESPDAVDALTAQLEDPSWVVRAQAVRALGLIGDPAALPAVAPLLRSGHPWLLYNAAAALYQMGAPGQLTLHQALESHDPADRLLAEIIVEVFNTKSPRR